MASKKDIAIFFWEGYLSVAPTIINLSESLAENGHRVIIFMRAISHEYSPDTKLHSNVRTVTLSNSKRYHRLTAIINKIPRVRTIFSKKYRERMALADLVRQSKKILQSDHFDCIGVDSIGLFWASQVMHKKSNLYYLSLELLCKDVIPKEDLFQQWIKQQEIIIHQRMVKNTLIQDQYRLKALLKENGVAVDSKYHILTNSPRNGSKVAGRTRSNYFNQLFSIPDQCTILLMAGWISDMMMAPEAVAAFGQFNNKNIKLVLHEREKRSESEPYLQDLKKSGKEQLYLSLNPLPYSEIGRVYGSADIGMVFYTKEMGENFELIVGASGKLGHYLMYGMPVISNDLPGFKELFDKYGIGVVINDFSQLEAAVNTILSNYDQYAANAYACYKQEYDFDFQFTGFYKSYLASS